MSVVSRHHQWITKELVGIEFDVNKSPITKNIFIFVAAFFAFIVATYSNLYGGYGA